MIARQFMDELFSCPDGHEKGVGRTKYENCDQLKKVVAL